jgi:hypothetical protein
MAPVPATSSYFLLTHNDQAHLPPTGWAQTLKKPLTFDGSKTFGKPLHC